MIEFISHHSTILGVEKCIVVMFLVAQSKESFCNRYSKRLCSQLCELTWKQLATLNLVRVIHDKSLYEE